ncbi:MAG TPA: PQQ-dependent sugar dehydrogenase, partial [Sphingomonadaceae bacterium]|nr:PQQ-dependent sugar dehydrogenase [Sphingomonadaceae bacterium]
MTISFRLAAIIAPTAISVASCGAAQTGDSSGNSANSTGPFEIEEVAKFDQPWAMAFEPGTGNIFVTEKGGGLMMVTQTGEVSEVGAAP